MLKMLLMISLLKRWLTMTMKVKILLMKLLLINLTKMVVRIQTVKIREEQVPPEILDLGFFTPFLSRPNPARTKIKDPETRPNSRNSSFKFLILSWIWKKTIKILEIPDFYSQILENYSINIMNFKYNQKWENMYACRIQQRKIHSKYLSSCLSLLPLPEFQVLNPAWNQELQFYISWFLLEIKKNLFKHLDSWLLKFLSFLEFLILAWSNF